MIVKKEQKTMQLDFQFSGFQIPGQQLQTVYFSLTKVENMLQKSFRRAKNETVYYYFQHPF